MSHNTKIRNVAIIVFGIVSVLFFVFFIYIGLFENISVYSARDSHSYTVVEDFSVEQVADEAAPAGVHTVYRWILDASDGVDNCLCFYLVHHYAQVYYDGELMYSLTAQSDNRIGGSIGSNWVTVSIYPEDTGKEVTVVLTPLFENVVDSGPQFLVGSHFSIIFEQLMQNTLQLFISALCVFVGIFIVAVELYLAVRSKVRAWDMLSMGAFAILLGLWQITGTKFSPLLFSANPMVLGYITIGVLFLCSTPLLIIASTYFHGKKKTLLWILSAVGSVDAALVLLLQVLGVADFKEMLVISHIMLLVTVCVIAAMALFHKKKDVGNRAHKSRRLLLLPAAGIVLDMVVFYLTDSSSDLFFATLVAFIVYALITFVASVFETTKKAYTDSHTGLTNKAHWLELMNANVPIMEPTVIMMLDLNGLKKVNDTMGHDAGDRMILRFSDILRRSLPKNSVICHWGGDEFAVMITGVNKKKVIEYVDAIRKETVDHNIVYRELPIYYAVGYALSTDFPNMSRTELLDEADRQMYLDKQRWYSERRAANKE